MSVIEKVPFLHEIVIADAQELVQVISPGMYFIFRPNLDT